MTSPVTDKLLELIEQPDDNRPNRLCVCLSDIHLTDGTVGFQNLGIETWDAFYSNILTRCITYKIKELVFVLDGDIVDMIRTDKWAKSEIYPWERERKEAFSAVVNDIVRDIVDNKHKDFFDWLKALPNALANNQETMITDEKDVKIVITLGNHDKEMFVDQKALTYFYKNGLGLNPEDLTEEYRRAIGRMYGNEELFLKSDQSPYLPFYFGDTGFRFFTTHGHWRDPDNSRAISAKNGMPGWNKNDGWQMEVWQKLGYAPFFEPCFGDTVAAGVLSTFIYSVKEQLDEQNYHDQRLDSILDELDLYRPTYGAIMRILDEAESMRGKKNGAAAVKIIEETLYKCIIDWLSWKFTYQSSPIPRRILLKVAKWIIENIHRFNNKMEIKCIYQFMKFMTWLSHYKKQPGEKFKTLKTFPSFLPEYRHYGFQIHGEGHTHQPLQEEPNIEGAGMLSYINFGTWRDQIVIRKEQGYRRRGVLRALFILDLKEKNQAKKGKQRSFNYFTEDILHWGDKADDINKGENYQPHT